MAILGPTAAGKTDLAIEVAREFGGDIVSVDSMQVYRGMNIGTAKPTVIERRGVVHHMIDVAEPEEEFTVAEFRRQGRAIMDNASVPLVVSGGSGLHFRALVDPMSFAPTELELRAELEELPLDVLVDELTTADASADQVVDVRNKRRVVRAVEIFRLTGETPSQRHDSAEAEDVRRYRAEVEFTAIGIDPGDLLAQRVSSRLASMRNGGLEDEVRALQPRLGRTAASAVGYREILDHLAGATDIDEAFRRIETNTLRLAKKQRTWFQRDPRIRWIPWQDDLEARTRRALEALS